MPDGGLLLTASLRAVSASRHQPASGCANKAEQHTSTVKWDQTEREREGGCGGGKCFTGINKMKLSLWGQTVTGLCFWGL